jgi:8-oxo-dGTP pyrophosphatase MutT (NUDIX family)/GNAT superfamily N-acetyltransferase
MILGKSQRDREETEVASIAVLRDGELLWLRRADSGLWTMPGGHLNPGEEPLAGAIRELREETGLTPHPGDFEFLGDDLVPGNSKLRIFSFAVEVPSDTAPDLSKDPDQEASEFKWWDELPESEQCHVPHASNVTLKLLLDEGEITKAERKEWRAKDGLKIPHHTTPERADWDKAYHAKLVEFFGNGDAKRLKSLKIPITPQTSGNNPVVSKARYSLYTRMLSGGDRLPPLVVRRNGLGWHVIDGNHRLEAGLKRGLKEMDAYELVDPPKVKKSEEPLDKMAIKDLKAPPKASHKTHRAGYGVGDRYDYSHLLPDAFKGRFKLAVDYHHDGHETAPFGYVTSSLVHPRDWRKNNVESEFLGTLETKHLDAKYHDPDEAGLHVDSAKIESPVKIDGKWEILHGKGLGQALYEAAYAHAYHHLGERVVRGAGHSTMAGRVHEKLAEKHGLKYYAEENPDKHNNADGSFDNAYGEYAYTLKSDDEEDASFDFGANAPEHDPLYQKALKSIARMHPKNQEVAHAWIAFTRGHTAQRPTIHPDLERHLARFGIVDPKGFPYQENGRSMERPVGGKRASGRKGPRQAQPEGLRAYRGLDVDYFMPYQRSEELALKSDREDLVAAATESLDNSLRKPQYRSSPNPLTGHCYVASEALWHLMGGHESGWVPQNVKHEGDQHWYLRHSKTGEILDPTAGQFRTPVPYHQGRGRGFLTKDPSKRAAELINRIKSKLDKSEPLEKGFLTTAALAGSLALGQVNGADPDPKPSKALIEATQRVGIPAEPVKWSALGLHQSLIPIAHLESSFGQNVAHAKHPKGDYHTAHGALGFKPVTAHEEYLRAPALQKLYGDLKDPAVFMSKFKSDPKFYNLVATSHFMRLQKQHGSPERAAYAWRWGTGACQGASDEQVANEPYVMRYRDLAANAGLKKMAIKDLKPGKQTDPDSNEFDYSHMIKSPLLRRTYKLVVHHWPGDEYGDVAKASLVHRQTGNVAGFVEGSNEFVGTTRAINPSYAVIRDESIQGKGLGKALYSALFAHAHHVLGYKQVVGGEHSTSAHRVHEKLAEKHGWDYKPEFKPRQAPQERPFDGEYGPYQYKLT